MPTMHQAVSWYGVTPFSRWLTIYGEALSSKNMIADINQTLTTGRQWAKPATSIISMNSPTTL